MLTLIFTAESGIWYLVSCISRRVLFAGLLDAACLHLCLFSDKTECTSMTMGWHGNAGREEATSEPWHTAAGVLLPQEGGGERVGLRDYYYLVCREVRWFGISKRYERVMSNIPTLLSTIIS